MWGSQFESDFTYIFPTALQAKELNVISLVV